MNRIKRISMQLLDLHKDFFSDDFERNKEVLNKLSIIRSKGLKNAVAGYITVHMKVQKDGYEEKEEESAESADVNE